jgi:hypothetical protein
LLVPEFWFLKVCKNRLWVVEVIGWSKKDVLLEDVKTGLKIALDWDIFMEDFRKLEYNECDISTYTGANLDIK